MKTSLRLIELARHLETETVSPLGVAQLLMAEVDGVDTMERELEHVRQAVAGVKAAFTKAGPHLERLVAFSEQNTPKPVDGGSNHA